MMISLEEISFQYYEHIMRVLCSDFHTVPIIVMVFLPLVNLSQHRHCQYHAQH